MQTPINLIIVEDDLTTQKLYKEIFKLLGSKNICMINNGFEALKKFKSIKKYPDLIIMDYDLPNIDGLELIKILLKRDCPSKIFLISGNTNIKEYVFMVMYHIKEPKKIKVLF